MNVSQRICPPVERLADFSAGRLSASESEEIDRHLAECPSCCQKLKLLPDDDTLVGILRQREVDTASDRGMAATLPPPDPHATLLPNEDGTVNEFAAGDGRSQLPDALRNHPRYRVLELLGRGGMGDVYKAQHQMMNRPVAIKLISADLVRSEAAIHRFHREVQAAAKLSHPNIVAAYDAEQAGDTHFLVMEYVDGVDLAEVVRHRGPLPVAEACRFVLQAAKGLQHACEQGMVHRDIKPQNLMLTSAGVVKILDFGLANLAEAVADEQPQSQAVASLNGVLDRQLTLMGSVMGTPDYMAPEQADDAHSADIRADIYSLGCTLYCLLTGDAPFSGRSVLEKIQAHSKQPVPQLTTMRSDVPAELAEVVQRMMAKSPAERYQTPAEVVAALEPFARETPSDGMAAAERQAKPRRSWSMMLAISATLLLGMLAALGAAIVVFTDQGRLEIQSEVSDVRVAVKKGGDEIAIIDLQTGSQIKWLPTGKYELELVGGDNDLKFEPTSWEMARLGKVIVKARWNSEDAGVVRAFTTADPPITRDNVRVDQGGWKITATETRTVPLFEIVNPKLDAGQFFYRAKLKCEIPQGRATPTMQIRIPGQDEQVAKSVNSIIGSSDWVIFEVPFLLKQGEQPDLVKLNLTIEGGGTVWIKEIVLLGRVISPTTSQPDEDSQLEETGRLTGHKDNVAAIAFSPNGKRLYSGGGEGRLYEWDVAAGTVLRKILIGGNLQSIAVLPDGERVITGDFDGTVKMWNLADGKLVREFSGHTQPVRSICVSPNGKSLLSGSNDGLVRLWDTETGEPIHSFSLSYSDCVAMTKDGRLAAHGTAHRELKIWETESGQILQTIKHESVANTLAFSPDGTYLVSGDGYGLIQVWEVATGNEIHHLKVDRERVGSLVFTPDGRHFLSGSHERMLRMFELAGGTEIFRVQAETSCFTHLALSPDGRTLASGGGLQSQYVKQKPSWSVYGDYDVHFWRLPENVWPKSPHPRGSAAFRLLSDEYEWTEPENLGPQVNSDQDDIYPWVSADGLTLMFGSTRKGSAGDYDIWQCTRSSVDDAWSDPVNLGEPINTIGFDAGGQISADGCTLVFVSMRAGGLGAVDLWMATRKSVNDPWGEPVNLGDSINSHAGDIVPSLSADGLRLIYNSNREGNARPWIAERGTAGDAWSKARPFIEVGRRTGRFQFLDFGSALFNSPWKSRCNISHWNTSTNQWDASGTLAPCVDDGNGDTAFFCETTSTLYFDSTRPGGLGKTDLWMSRRVKRQSLAVADKNQLEAVKAAEAYLAVVDEGKFDELREMVSSWAKQQVTREQISQTYQKLRDTFGKATQRTLTRVQLYDEFPGLPKGRYAGVQYKTDCERQSELWESLLVNLDTDGKWRVNTYTVTVEPMPFPDGKPEPFIEQKKQAALAATQEWLKLVDAGKYAESWETSAKINRDGVNKQELVEAYNDLFKPLGKRTWREHRSSEFTTQMPRAPVGEYAVIQFRTQFTNDRIIETVVLTREPDGQWRVSGYFHAEDNNPPTPPPAISTQIPSPQRTGLLTNPPKLPPSGLPVERNLIVDPSLEDTATGQLPNGWFAWLNDGPDFKCEVVEGGVTGKHCLQISGTGTRGLVFATSIPLDRTKRYSLKGRVRVEGEAGTWAVIKLNYFNSTDWLGVDDRVGVTTADLDWNFFEKTDFADRYPGATLIVPTCHIEGNGTAWFDDLEVIAYDRENLPDDFDAVHGKNNRMK